MRIAVNTQLLIKDRLEGIGWFSYETLKRITRAHPEHEFYFIFDRAWHQSFIFSDNVIPLKTSLPSRHPLLWLARFHHTIPAILRRIGADLFYSPDGWSVIKPDIPVLLALHDLNFIHHPGNLPRMTSWYFRTYFPTYAREARRLITVSEFSRQDIAQSFKIDPKQIDVAYNGVSDVFKPVSQERIRHIRQKYSQGEKYFIFVGALNPRKNLSALLRAFDAFCDRSNDRTRLMVIGAPMFSERFHKLKDYLPRHADRIDFMGRLDHGELAALVAAAHALVLPSTFEGFGIPIIEAMQCDVPVITSNVTSMPEVAGDAALLADPYSVESIAEALILLDQNQELHASLIDKGRIRRQAFSWDKTAETIYQSMEACFI